MSHKYVYGTALLAVLLVASVVTKVTLCAKAADVDKLLRREQPVPVQVLGNPEVWAKLYPVPPRKPLMAHG